MRSCSSENTLSKSSILSCLALSSSLKLLFSCQNFFNLSLSILVQLFSYPIYALTYAILLFIPDILSSQSLFVDSMRINSDQIQPYLEIRLEFYILKDQFYYLRQRVYLRIFYSSDERLAKCLLSYSRDASLYPSPILLFFNQLLSIYIYLFNYAICFCEISVRDRISFYFLLSSSPNILIFYFNSSRQFSNITTYFYLFLAMIRSSFSFFMIRSRQSKPGVYDGSILPLALVGENVLLDVIFLTGYLSIKIIITFFIGLNFNINFQILKLQAFFKFFYIIRLQISIF